MPLLSKPRLVSPALLAAALALSGCAATPGPASSGYTPLRAMGSAADDTGIRIGVESRLVSLGTFSTVTVRVFRGRVLLVGRVPDAETRALAMRAALSATGVREVLNELIVGPPVGTLANIEDLRISTQVRAGLLANANINQGNYDVTTSDGVVHLLGVTPSEVELRLAAESASRVLGVRNVQIHVLSATDPRAGF